MHLNPLDLLLLVITSLYAISGFTKGALVGVLSFIGFFGGAVIGAQQATAVARRLSNGSAQVPIAVGFVIVAALLGQFVAVRIAARIRSRVTSSPAKFLDSVAGALISAAAALLVAWMIAVPLASAPIPAVAGQVRRSEVIHGVDAALPAPVHALYSSLRTFIDRSGFPQVLTDLRPTDATQVAPADSALLRSAAVAADRSSVLKVNALAPSCQRAIEGSSFVYAPQHLLTNAHVVAGAAQVSVVTAQGPLPATVVLFDPVRDVAVLYVAQLHTEPLRLASAPAKSGQDAIVLGYPQDQPFDVRAARVRDSERFSGRDIYGQGSVLRDVYTIRSTVRPGNSGGPLIDTRGAVLGIVFASALDSADTGFVLTVAEIAADAGRSRTAIDAVGTGHCD